jgi:hypothetical protein
VPRARIVAPKGKPFARQIRPSPYAGHSLRAPDVPQAAGVHPRRRAHAHAGYRGEHRHLQPPLSDPAAPPPICPRGPAGVRLEHVSADGTAAGQRVDPRLSRPQDAGPRDRRGGALHRSRCEPRGRGQARTGARVGGHPVVLRHARPGAVHRPRFQRRRSPARCR